MFGIIKESPILTYLLRAFGSVCVLSINMDGEVG